MERLTVKSEIDDNQYVLRCLCSFGRDGIPDDEDACDEICDHDCDNCGIMRAFNRLAAYENTNLAPEEITDMQKQISLIRAYGVEPDRIGQLFNELAAYRNTGLTPEKIIAIRAILTNEENDLK